MEQLYDVNVRGYGQEIPYTQGLYFKAAIDTSVRVAEICPDNRVYVRPTRMERPGFINSIPAPLSVR